MSELPIIRGEVTDMRKQVSCLTLGYQEVMEQFSSAFYLNAFTTILVLSGTGVIRVNYRSYPIHKDMLFLFTSSHLFHFEECSPDLKCIALCVSREFAEEMDSTTMISQRTRYGVRLYNSPVMQLQRQQVAALFRKIILIQRTIDYPEHFYYKDAVQNSLFGFYLDLSDIIERYTHEGNKESGTDRKESIIQCFIELLATHYRTQHKVDFYASRLHISSHYLTSVVKSVTGQSVSDFIFEMIYSEARTLLAHPQLSIQEIAATLHFSDQSAFEKFFKRRAGVSPFDFRRELRNRDNRVT